MKTSLTAFLLIAGSVMPIPANAQAVSVPATAPTPPPTSGDRLERWLDLVENNAVVRLLATRDGVGLRVGGIEGGSGFAVGPSWQSRRALGGRFQLAAAAVISPFRDRAVDAGATIPELASHRLTLRLAVGASHLAHESFYGIGADTSRDRRAEYSLDRRSAGLAATIVATGRLQITAATQIKVFVAGDGARASVPAISLGWPDIPAFAVPLGYSVNALGAVADFRDVPGNPRRGGRYAMRIERHRDRTLGRYSFNRIDLDVEQHISWWRRERLVTLRALAVHSNPDRGHDVPFFLQPTLGGSTWLRGFPTDRFRDRNLLAIQAEYGWDIWPFLNALLFYEAGQVAPRWSDLLSGGFKRDYGFGFRFGSARTVAVRADVAFGSGEGTRFSMRFSHAF